MLFFAKVYENGSNSCRKTSESRNQTSSYNSDLCRIQFVVVNDKYSVFEGDSEPEDENHDQLSNAFRNVAITRTFFACNKNQNDRTGQRKRKEHDSSSFSRKLTDDKIGNWIDNELREPNDKTINENIEIKLVKHQGRGIE